MNNDEKNEVRRSFRMAVLFSLLVFFIFVATMSLVFGITMILYAFGFKFAGNLKGILFIFTLVSIAVGTLISRIVGTHVMGSIVSATKAAQEVAKGNFNVVIKEDIPAEEIRELAHSFNIMTKELSKTEILRTDFISNVSHEFKTPLSAIEGYAMLLQSKSISDEKRDEYTQKIVDNVKRLSTLTGNILQLSKLENQNDKIEKSEFSLDEQIRQTVLLLESQWSAKNINLDINLDEVKMNGNPELLSEVWLNIIGNSLKFTPDNGNLTINLVKHGGYCKVTISDNGIGMDEETLKRIFEKFYQGDSSHATKGNGLGLTLVKKIVELHGGSILVSSALGDGTTFEITLPTI